MNSEMRPRVVIVCPGLGLRGSVANVALNHAQQLAQLCAVTLISDTLPSSLPPGVVGIAVSALQFRFLRRFAHVPRELAFLWAVRSTLHALAPQRQIDVVWCHSHAAVAIAAAPLRIRLGFRIVMTTHGDIFERPGGTYSRDLTWFYRRVTPSAYKKTDFVQALSPFMGELACRHGAQGSKVYLIPNGVDPAEIGLNEPLPRPASSFMPKGVLRLLYVGTLTQIKGVDVLLRAVQQLRDKGTNNDTEVLKIHLRVIGEGADRGKLDELNSELGLSDAVEFVGRVERRDLASHFRNADVLCVPSRSDPLPTVVLEAMTSGLPVIGSATGGIPFMIEDGVTGYLVPVEDEASLALAIRRAAMSSHELARLGQAGCERSSQIFAWPAIGSRLRELISHAMSFMGN